MFFLQSLKMKYTEPKKCLFHQTAADYMNHIRDRLKQLKRSNHNVPLHSVPQICQYRRHSPHVKTRSASLKRLGIVSKEGTKVSTKNHIQTQLLMNGIHLL